MFSFGIAKVGKKSLLPNFFAKILTFFVTLHCFRVKSAPLNSKCSLMDVDLLSKIIKELILDKDRVVLPGLGCFVAEVVPATFSDKGYTINPPYRKLSFRSKPDMGDELIDFYVETNGLDREVACRILGDFISELRQVIFTKKVVVLPGLGRLRATKENNLFFIPDEDLDIYPAGVGLEPISLKTHVETPQEVAAALSDLKSIMEDVTPVESIFVDPQNDIVVVQDEVAVVQDDVADGYGAVEDVYDAEEDIQEEAASQQEDEADVLGNVQVEMIEVVVPEVEDKTDTKGEADVEECRPAKRGRKVFAVLVASVLLFFAAYTLVATLVPGVFDKFLYTPEELEILNYRK